MATNNIIDEVITTDKTRENIRKAIPFLVHLAQTRKQGTYKELIGALGYETYSGIGTLLGNIENVVSALGKTYGHSVPSLNALIVNKNGLPSDGFAYVYPIYDKLTNEEKITFVNGHNEKVYSYPDWNWVLKALELRPAAIVDSEYTSKLRSSVTIHGHGGEGPEHKAIKQAITDNPQLIGFDDVKSAQTEYTLLSGDRIDVLLVLKNDDHIAVEVKPSTASQEDITRGIFQCVKYKAVMDAERNIESAFYKNSSILVLAGTMSEQNKRIAKDLSVSYIDGFMYY